MFKIEIHSFVNEERFASLRSACRGISGAYFFFSVFFSFVVFGYVRVLECAEVRLLAVSKYYATFVKFLIILFVVVQSVKR